MESQLITILVEEHIPHDWVKNEDDRRTQNVLQNLKEHRQPRSLYSPALSVTADIVHSFNQQTTILMIQQGFPTPKYYFLTNNFQFFNILSTYILIFYKIIISCA